MKLNNYLKISLVIISTLFFFQSFAQDYSWVYFTDKDESNLDYFDLPVSDTYLSKIRNLDIEIFGTSKWLNAACISFSDAPRLKSLPYVAHVEPLQKYNTVEESIASVNEDFSYGWSDIQIEMLNLHRYHALGNTGRGVRLALFDGGFYGVDTLQIFSSLWENNQIEATRDFVKNDKMSFRESTHGMQVLALAGINHSDSMIGAAPGADFILARTEDVRSERHIEEMNWLRAMEWADSVGVDIIHSSLGYSLFDSLEGSYTYQDMDGQSTIITIAAQRAAQRGIFITNSAGNSGNDPWFHITAPCDGKDVLCVGAVDSFKNLTAFSSRGPSADGRIKPDVTAMGAQNVIPRGNGLLRKGNGTSFSGPLIAGLVACLMEAHPNRTNQEIFNSILKSSDRFENPDNEYGYGIPDALAADSILRLNPDLVSLENIEKLKLSVYPNPASNYLKVQCEPETPYVLTNMKGQVILSGTLNNWINFIELDNIKTGSYMLTVTKDHATNSKKIFIQN